MSTGDTLRHNPDLTLTGLLAGENVGDVLNLGDSTAGFLSTESSDLQTKANDIS